MTEQEIFDEVIVGGMADLAFLIETLAQERATWCVIDNFAINAYAPPVYTADFDLVVASAKLETLLQKLNAANFRVRKSARAISIRREARKMVQGTHPLTVRFATLDRYQPFIARAATYQVLGWNVPVAALADVVQGKLWALDDPVRKAGEHAKDRFDLIRLAEKYFDEVVPLLPDELRAVAESDRTHRLDIGNNGWGEDDRGED